MKYYLDHFPYNALADEKLRRDTGDKVAKALKVVSTEILDHTIRKYYETRAHVSDAGPGSSFYDFFTTGMFFHTVSTQKGGLKSLEARMPTLDSMLDSGVRMIGRDVDSEVSANDPNVLRMRSSKATRVLAARELVKNTLNRINRAARDESNVVACYPGARVHERRVFLEVVQQLFHSLQTQATALNVFYSGAVLRKGKYLDMIRRDHVRKMKRDPNGGLFPIKIVLTRQGVPIGQPITPALAGAAWTSPDALRPVDELVEPTSFV